MHRRSSMRIPVRSLAIVAVSVLLLASPLLADPGATADRELEEAAAFERTLAAQPDDFEALVGAAGALNAAMAIRTNGNLPLVDGLQDSEENRALWRELAPRALAHARKATTLQPDSPRAVAALATAYMFHASSLGILRSILQGAGNEYREHARRLIALDPTFDDALGHLLMGSFYLVAPWPIADADEARASLEEAATLAPASARNQYTLAVYWAREGDRDRARAHFERVVSTPCTLGTERLFCDWIQAESRRQLAALARPDR